MNTRFLIERMAVRVRWVFAFLFFALWLSVVGSTIYVAVHFVEKYW